MIQNFDTNLHTNRQTVQIQISWLLQKPTDLDLHCLQRQGIFGFSRTRDSSAGQGLKRINRQLCQKCFERGFTLKEKNLLQIASHFACAQRYLFAFYLFGLIILLCHIHYWHYLLIKQYKWRYPGNATITKHSLHGEPQEGEMGNK